MNTKKLSMVHMKHCKRKRLLVEDFNRALKVARVEPLFGHGDEELSPSFRQVPEAGVSVLHSQDVDLRQSVQDPDLDGLDTGQTTVKASWTAASGAPSTSSVEGPARKVVCTDIKTYSQDVCRAILGSDEETARMALSDLMTNPNVGPVYPIIARFLLEGTRFLLSVEFALRRLLETVDAVTNNSHVLLEAEPSADMLVQSLLFVLLHEDPVIFNIRAYAAYLLAKLTRDWKSSGSLLRTKLVKMYIDQTIGARSEQRFAAGPLYGALTGLEALGPQTFRSLMGSHSEAFLNLFSTLDITFPEDDYLTVRFKLKDLMLRCLKDILSSNVREPLPPWCMSAHERLREEFGDSLTLPSGTAVYPLPDSNEPPQGISTLEAMDTDKEVRCKATRMDVRTASKAPLSHKAAFECYKRVQTSKQISISFGKNLRPKSEQSEQMEPNPSETPSSVWSNKRFSHLTLPVTTKLPRPKPLSAKLQTSTSLLENLTL